MIAAGQSRGTTSLKTVFGFMAGTMSGTALLLSSRFGIAFGRVGAHTFPPTEEDSFQLRTSQASLRVPFRPLCFPLMQGPRLVSSSGATTVPLGTDPQQTIEEDPDVIAEPVPLGSQDLGPAEELRATGSSVLHVAGMQGRPLCGVIAKAFEVVSEPGPSFRTCRHPACTVACDFWQVGLAGAPSSLIGVLAQLCRA